MTSQQHGVSSQAQQEIVAQNRAQAVCRRQCRIQVQNTVLSKAQKQILAQFSEASLADLIDNSEL